MPDTLCVHISAMPDVQMDSITRVAMDSLFAHVDSITSVVVNIANEGAGYPSMVSVIAIPLIIAIFAFAAPLLRNVVNEIEIRYKCSEITNFFNSYRPYLCFKSLLVINIFEVFVYALCLEIPRFQYPQVFSAILCVSTFCLVCSTLYFIRKSSQFSNPAMLYKAFYEKLVCTNPFGSAYDPSRGLYTIIQYGEWRMFFRNLSKIIRRKGNLGSDFMLKINEREAFFKRLQSTLEVSYESHNLNSFDEICVLIRKKIDNYQNEIISTNSWNSFSLDIMFYHMMHDVYKKICSEDKHASIDYIKKILEVRLFMDEYKYYQQYINDDDTRFLWALVLESEKNEQDVIVECELELLTNYYSRVLKIQQLRNSPSYETSIELARKRKWKQEQEDFKFLLINLYTSLFIKRNYEYLCQTVPDWTYMSPTDIRGLYPKNMVELVITCFKMISMYEEMEFALAYSWKDITTHFSSCSYRHQILRFLSFEILRNKLPQEEEIVNIKKSIKEIIGSQTINFNALFKDLKICGRIIRSDKELTTANNLSTLKDYDNNILAIKKIIMDK